MKMQRAFSVVHKRQLAGSPEVLAVYVDVVT